MLAIVICVFAVIIIFQEILHAAERRDLYNRMMSENIKEYKEISKKRSENKKYVSRRQRAVREWQNIADGSDGR